MDDLRVVLLGTGSPSFTLERAGPAQIVLAGETAILVDCGDSAIRQIMLAGLEPAEIRNVFFTHLHSDHTLGYGSFVLGGWRRGRTELRIWGPSGTIVFHHKLFGDLYSADIAYRLSLGRNGSGLTDARLTEVDDGWRGEVGGLRVRAAAGAHVFPNLGYRFEYAGRSIVISGDTAYCPAIVDLARGADLLIQDSTNAPSPLFADGNAAQVFQRFSAHHTGPEEAGRIAREAGVGHLVLTHLLPGVATDEVLGRAQSEFPGLVTVGEDLLELRA